MTQVEAAAETQSSISTPADDIRVEVVDFPLSTVVEFDSIETLPSGTYLLYGDWWYQELDYAFLDGTRHGRILRLVETPDVVQVSNDINNLQVFTVDYEQGRLILHRIGLQERTILSYEITITDENAVVYCDDSRDCAFSSDGNWFLGTIDSGGFSIPFVVDLINLSGAMLSTGSNNCYSAEGLGGWNVVWSPDNTWFHVDCNSQYSSNNQEVTCLSPISGHEMVCQSPFGIYATSASHVAAYSRRFNEHTGEAENILVIADKECLMTGEECDYLYQQAVEDGLTAAWDQTGRYLVWFSFPTIASGGSLQPSYTTIGIVNAQTGEARVITEWGPIGALLYTISPDGEWALFMRAGAPISAISLDTLVVITYPFLENSPFYSWWVVP